MDLPVYVVSLVRHAETRRPSIAKQMQPLGITFEFVDAVDGVD